MEASKRRVVLGNLVGVSENQGYLIVGVLTMILLFRKLYWGPPIFGNSVMPTDTSIG